MKSYEVHFEKTPNPATLKFNLPHPTGTTGREFANVNEAHDSPLAMKLFGFPWTSAVYLGPEFVTVTKQDWVDWEVLANPLCGLIAEHLQSGEALYAPVEASESTIDDSPLVQKIKVALDRDIRPIVGMDGGDVTFHKLDGDRLYVRMQGACSGCPSSTATLKEGIEVRMRELFPEISEVVAI